MKESFFSLKIQHFSLFIINYSLRNFVSLHAAVVQLEERFPAKEEVIGSNPIGCTIVHNSELQFATFGLLELFFVLIDILK